MMTFSDAIARPVDFFIRTEAQLRYFLLKIRREKAAYKPSRALKLCIHFARKIQVGKLDVILPNGQKIRFEGPDAGPEAILILHNDRAAKKLLSAGKLGFCESYLDGDWTSPNIADFYELVLRNESILLNVISGKVWFRKVAKLIHMLNANSKGGSLKNIYRHYDIGNDFYARWLDPSMTYSSALFRGEEAITLEQAQDVKYQEMINRLGIESHHHVLEIGCGWGGFAEYAVRQTGCQMTCITISQAQYDYAVERVKAAGLSDKISIKMQDYRDIKGQYDRIASIEMFEAVGEQYWPTFFNQLKKSLKPDGKACLQIITIEEESYEDYKSTADYIQRYIFPGGMLPSMSALEKQITQAELKTCGHLSFGRDYAKTLALWNDKFQEEWPDLTKDGFDDRFKRLWEQYLNYCEAGFSAETIDVIQIDLHHA
jgi:cyclopropane-fatty-acyl-phospholipid synthase